MKEYRDLIMGLVAGLALTFLNNNGVHDSLSYIFTLFDPTNFKFLFLARWISNFNFKDEALIVSVAIKSTSLFII